MEKEHPCPTQGTEPCGEEKKDPGLDGVDDLKK